MLKFGIVGDGNDGIAPFTGCPVPVPTSKPDQYTPITLLFSQHRPRSSCGARGIGRDFRSPPRFTPLPTLLPPQLGVITSWSGKGPPNDPHAPRSV